MSENVVQHFRENTYHLDIINHSFLNSQQEHIMINKVGLHMVYGRTA